MNIDDLTLGQLKEITALTTANKESTKGDGLSGMIGKKCIIRTYSAGVWFGLISEKYGKEVIVSNARRMYRWWAAESISLSAVAQHGIKRDKSKICGAVESVWLEAIEIIPCTAKATESIEGADNVEAS